MYKISRYTSFIEKDDIFAVYCNFNLYFFKGRTYRWFKQLAFDNSCEKIEKDFIDFLLKNEIIVSGDENV